MRVYELNGSDVRTLEEFYVQIGEAINGPNGYFGSNLDAFWECLHGGYGTPDGDYTIRWLQSDDSRRSLGYPETVRQLELRLLKCHPTNHDHVRLELKQATKGKGQTVFDWLVDLIHAADGVTLELR